MCVHTHIQDFKNVVMVLHKRANNHWYFLLTMQFSQGLALIFLLEAFCPLPNSLPLRNTHKHPWSIFIYIVNSVDSPFFLLFFIPPSVTEQVFYLSIFPLVPKLQAQFSVSATKISKTPQYSKYNFVLIRKTFIVTVRSLSFSIYCRSKRSLRFKILYRTQLTLFLIVALLIHEQQMR